MSASVNPSSTASSDMEQVAAGFATKSDKIRALAKAGYTRSQIAGFLGIRYQHVRNVLVGDELVGRGAPTRDETHARPPATDVQQKTAHSSVARRRVETGGHVVIPPEYLRALGLKENDSVILTLENDKVELMSLAASVRRAQAIVRQFVPAGVSLVDELLAERREEALRENGGE